MCCSSNGEPFEAAHSIESISTLAEPSAKPLWVLDVQEAEIAAKQRMDELLALRKAQEEATEAKKREALEAAEEATKKREEEAAAAAAAAASPAKKAGAKRAPKASKPEVEAPPVVVEVVDYSKALYDLEVKVISANNLRNADWITGTSDPYCLCEATGKLKGKFKTKTIDNKTDPVWNQAARMTLAHGDPMKFTVFDKDDGKEDDMLGWFSLPFDKIVPSGFEGDLTLKEASSTAVAQHATLRLRVKILKSYTEENETKVSIS